MSSSYKTMSRSQDEPLGDQGSTAERFGPVGPDKSNVEPVSVRFCNSAVDNPGTGDATCAEIT